jgi:hypothetical protein
MRPVADKQIVLGAAATLTVQFTDSDGIPAAPSGVVTVGITKADGTVLVAAGTATVTPADTTTRTYALAAVNTLELLTVAWTDAGDASVTTQLVEVVGGYYFTPAELRAFDTSTADGAQYTDAQIVDARRQVEEQFEQVCGVAFVPRYRRVRLTGDIISIKLPDPMLRTLRSIRFYTGASTYTSGDVNAIAGVGVGDAEDARAGVATRFDLGWWVIPLTTQSTVVEYEHGYSRPPSLLKQAAMVYCRNVLNNLSRSSVIDRADSFQMIDGGVIRYAQPGRAGYHTGLPSVDQILDQYSMKVPGLA